MPAIPQPHPTRCAPERLDYADIIDAHERAVVCGEATYRDPCTGLMVLTVTALFERGQCCHSGCRHCPYVA